MKLQEYADYKRVVIERTPEYEFQFKIPSDYLENRGIELKEVSIVLNEIEDEYLMLDAYYQGVWIPKEIIEPEKIIIDDDFNSK
ncbi:MAG: hypothetical protein ACLFMM_04705 [Methanohalobium sp.]|uniref:hypothetical protein n=1 Tax=Methanohalobium sp. TaxID=2837493 RepID=UPI00397D31B1